MGGSLEGHGLAGQFVNTPKHGRITVEELALNLVNVVLQTHDNRVVFVDDLIEHRVQHRMRTEPQEFRILFEALAHAREIGGFGVPDGDGEVGADEQVHLAELNLLGCVEISRGPENDEECVAIALEFGTLVAGQGILYGEGVEIEFHGDGAKLLLCWPIHANPGEATVITQVLEGEVEGNRMSVAHTVSVDCIIDDGHFVIIGRADDRLAALVTCEYMSDSPHAVSAEYDFVVVSNRLPVDHVTDDDGVESWTRSPGGLVTALEPVMREAEGAWVGWGGQPDLEIEPFENDGIHIVPIALGAVEIEEFYEGFSNDTLWPLYHDVISSPAYHREWWECYVKVNQRFAAAAAAVSAQGAVVWVHDYQLQLVPKMLREIRPDLTIGFFNHIPFPPYGIYSQLPWRTQIIEGLLGADVIGFQRVADASNFLQAARRLTGSIMKSPVIEVASGDQKIRRVVARAFPISIDAQSFEELAREPRIQERAREIREGLGNPRTVMLGVDRLDYTKGIGHRLKAFGELLAEGRVDVEDVTLVQVASPSRERVGAYMQLRDEIELTVGRINGDFATMSHTAISYHHHGYPRDEMVALYLAADILLVTALRDGMNLVAKEYVASRFDDDGVLVLSEFTGASDELKKALLINPHDIDGLKDAILKAIAMPKKERGARMRVLRKRVLENDVARWSSNFLKTLEQARASRYDRIISVQLPDELEWTIDRRWTD